MTHTLHRVGTIESLQNDICVMAHPQKGANYEGSKPHLQWFFKTAQECGAINMGSIVTGNMVVHSLDEILDTITDGRGTFVVFDNKDNVEKFIRLVKEYDGPISVVITALWDLVVPICEKAGVTPHTVNRALGIWGNKKNLADESVREFTSMCGHALVSRRLVEKVLEDVKKGKIAPREAALKLAKPCLCGFFNTTRAEGLINEKCCK